MSSFLIEAAERRPSEGRVADHVDAGGHGRHDAREGVGKYVDMLGLTSPGTEGDFQPRETSPDDFARYFLHNAKD